MDSPLDACPLDPAFATWTTTAQTHLSAAAPALFSSLSPYTCAPPVGDVADCDDARTWCDSTHNSAAAGTVAFMCASGDGVATFGCATNMQEACTGTFDAPSPKALGDFDQTNGSPDCPRMNNCAGAKLWCMQRVDQTDYEMDFTCSRDFKGGDAPTANEYGCRTTGATATDCTGEVVPSACAQHDVNLGLAKDYAVLAYSKISSLGTSAVGGPMGLHPSALTLVTGFGGSPAGGPGNSGAIEAATPAALLAKGDLGTAYTDAAGRTLCPVLIIGELGGLTLAPGLYKSTDSHQITLGDLTLDAQGDKDAVFIFQMASTFLSATGKKVVLAGGAQAKHIFWQVGSSATLGELSHLEGTMMAYASITMGTLATVNGRVLASNAAVTMLTGKITLPAV
jgi:hypothetical protein